MSEGLNNGGIISEGLAVGLAVGLQEEGELEGLRGLHEAEEGAIDSAGGTRA